MRGIDFNALDLNIGRARIGLSLVGLVSIYIDPTTGGLFGIAPQMLVVLACHFAYGIAAYTALNLHGAPERLPSIATGLDIFFASALALCTEGPTSPSYAFFTFAIIAAGCRFNFRTTSLVILCGVAVYWVTILFVGGVARNLYIMRPAYLAITGYLIAFLGQQRANFEARIRELETLAERHRIARSLREGCVQSLAGFNLSLASCRELLLRGRQAEALAQVTELREGVVHEYDQIRSYICSLASLDR